MYADGFPPHKYVSPAGLCDPACSCEVNGKARMLRKYGLCTNTSYNIPWKPLKAGRLVAFCLSLQEVRDDQLLDIVWVTWAGHYLDHEDEQKKKKKVWQKGEKFFLVDVVMCFQTKPS